MNVQVLSDKVLPVSYTHLLLTHSGRFTPENPEQRVTLSLQSPLMGYP